MAKKIVKLADLRALMLEEIEKDPRCEGVDRVSFYQVDEPGAQNWTVGFIGGTPGSQAAAATAAIITRLGAEYDVAWETAH